MIIDLLYGSDITRNFTHEQLDFGKVVSKVFRKKWDDIWLSLKLAISQRTLLLRYRNSIIKELGRSLTKKADPTFRAYYEKFLTNPEDIESLSECVTILKRKMGSLTSISDGDIADCVYAYAGAHYPFKRFKSHMNV